MGTDRSRERDSARTNRHSAWVDVAAATIGIYAAIAGVGWLLFGETGRGLAASALSAGLLYYAVHGAPLVEGGAGKANSRADSAPNAGSDRVHDPAKHIVANRPADGLHL